MYQIWLKFTLLWLIAYINMNDVYFEINQMNWFWHMEVKNNTMLINSKDWIITITVLISNSVNF